MHVSKSTIDKSTERAPNVLEDQFSRFAWERERRENDNKAEDVRMCEICSSHRNGADTGALNGKDVLPRSLGLYEDCFVTLRYGDTKVKPPLS